MALLKTEVPRFAPGESLGAKVNRMYRYLQDLQRGLDFVLSHLGAENLNGNGFTLPVLSADGKEELGSLGAAGDGVGLMHGGWGLRVTANGIEVTEDGMTWGPLETGGEAPDLSGYVPTSRTVNGKALTSDISLSASDVGARSSSWMPTAADVGAVPTSRTVNNKALSANISLTASDVGARPSNWTPTASDVGAVPTSRTVNGKALSSNISLTASDVGARPSSWTPTASDVGAASTNHASTEQTYGITTASNYGHAKLVSGLLDLDTQPTTGGCVTSAVQGWTLAQRTKMKTKTVSGSTNANGNLSLGLSSSSASVLGTSSTSTGTYLCVPFLNSSGDWVVRVLDASGNRVASTNIGSVTVYYLATAS